MPKAAVLNQVGHPLVVDEVELEPPHAGEVQIRMAASGVCHSDLSVQNGTLLMPLPMVLGHEGAGVIEAVGEGVTDLAGASHAVAEYEDAVKAIAARGLNARISIKLSQLGQTVDRVRAWRT